MEDCRRLLAWRRHVPSEQTLGAVTRTTRHTQVDPFLGLDPKRANTRGQSTRQCHQLVEPHIIHT